MTDVYSYTRGNKRYYGWNLSNQHYVEDLK